MPPEKSDLTVAIVDLCSRIEAQMDKLRNDQKLTAYDILLALNNRITKEMDRMVYHVRRLIDQNDFLYDRVIALEKRDDPEKVPGRNRHLQHLQKRQHGLHVGSSENLAPIQRSGTRRPLHSFIRQAGQLSPFLLKISTSPGRTQAHESVHMMQPVTKTRLYRTWTDMKARCYRPTCHNYANYGGRGVRVCEEWRTSFSAFRTWAETAGYDDTLTIDRKDSNDHYTPRNCRWITFDAHRRQRKRGGLVIDPRTVA